MCIISATLKIESCRDVKFVTLEVVASDNKVGIFYITLDSQLTEFSHTMQSFSKLSVYMYIFQMNNDNIRQMNIYIERYTMQKFIKSGDLP